MQTKQIPLNFKSNGKMLFHEMFTGKGRPLHHSKEQSKVYFITWPVQNVTGQLLLLRSSEVGQHFFEANINGAVDSYELKMKFEM